MSEAAYAGREQTEVKHYILRHYLERFAHRVGFGYRTLTYVDTFAGPWNATTDNLSDTSFSIALTKLCEARETLATFPHARLQRSAAYSWSAADKPIPAYANSASRPPHETLTS